MINTINRVPICWTFLYKQINEVITEVLPIYMESQKRINPVIMDIHNSIMDIHNSVMDIDKLLIYIIQ